MWLRWDSTEKTYNFSWLCPSVFFSKIERKKGFLCHPASCILMYTNGRSHSLLRSFLSNVRERESVCVYVCDRVCVCVLDREWVYAFLEKEIERVWGLLSNTKTHFLHFFSATHCVHMCPTPSTPRGTAEQRRRGGPAGCRLKRPAQPAGWWTNERRGRLKLLGQLHTDDVRINSRKINTLTGTGYVSSFCDKTVSLFGFSRKK